MKNCRSATQCTNSMRQCTNWFASDIWRLHGN